MPPSPDSNVTALPPPRWMRHVESHVYTDEAHLARERADVFGRSWWIAARSDQLPHPGDYTVLDELGESLLVVRDDRGVARAFHNICRHRGSRLLEGRGHVDAIDCPYHGWRYGLDGRAVRIPRPEGLHGRLTGKTGLETIRTAEWGGFVWVCLSADTPPLQAFLGGIGDELESYRLTEFEPIQLKTFDLPCNWKALVENVTDFYHVPFVHKNTIAAHVPVGPDIRSYGDHTRQRLEIAKYSWRRALDRRCSRGGPYQPTQMSALHKYLLFPNTVLNVLPYHVTVMQVFPVTPRQTRLVYAFTRRRGARGVEWARGWATWAASRYILHEDLVILGRYQQGLDSGRCPRQVLHAEEDASAHFHGTLARYLSADAAPWSAGPAAPPERRDVAPAR
jgi:phenylpropionate dioxygenase-like ring-hydroxylating dioxygenase large terminal subunit